MGGVGCELKIPKLVYVVGERSLIHRKIKLCVLYTQLCRLHVVSFAEFICKCSQYCNVHSQGEFLEIYPAFKCANA